MKSNLQLTLVLALAAVHAKPDEYKLEKYVSASTDDLSILCEKERRLLVQLEDVIKQSGENSDQTLFSKFKSSEYDWMLESEEEFDCLSHVKNPLNGFHLVKRTAMKWPKFVESLQKSSKLKKIKSVVRSFPEERDFRLGAGFGILILQIYYNIELQDLINGTFRNPFGGPDLESRPLDLEDVLEISKIANYVQRLDKQIEWLQIGVKMAGNDGRGKIRKLLETAVIDHDHILQVSGYGSSSTITPDGLPEVPVFTFPYRVSLNIPHLAEKHEVEPSTVLKDSLRRHASEVSRIQVYKDIKVDEIPTQTKYLSKTFKRMWFHNQNTTIQLCQGVNLRSTSLDKDVKCTYIHYRDPYLLLGPFKLENLNLDPPVGIFRDFYTIRECESIKKRGRGNVKSTPFQGRGRTEYYNTQRVSKRVHLKEDGFKEGMSSSKRISLATKWIVHTQKWASDEYSLINYGIGGQIEVHVDYWNHENKRRGGSRIATFLGYVSQVGYGGRTVFPGLGLSVNPEQGSALFWYTLNSHEDYDSRMFHMGCPVLYGNKWVLTKWIYSDPQMWKIQCGRKPANFSPLKN